MQEKWSVVRVLHPFSVYNLAQRKKIFSTETIRPQLLFITWEIFKLSPRYPQHKLPVRADCCFVSMYSMHVSVSKWASKVNGCHRDEHWELGVEQALRETSLVCVVIAPICPVPSFIVFLFQHPWSQKLHACIWISKILSQIFPFIVLHVD